MPEASGLKSEVTAKRGFIVQYSDIAVNQPLACLKTLVYMVYG